jgi:membrane-bound inhibitor of C-type lysozyme
MTVCDRRFSHAHVARTGWALFSMATCLLMGPVQAQDSMSGAAVETQRTESSVIATVDHWSLAEMAGDTAYLEQMLLPQYESVNDDGSAHSKAQIVAGAAKRSSTDIATANSKLATYRKAHPYSSNVAIHDNTAVVTYYDPAQGAQKGIKSADIFIYADGHRCDDNKRISVLYINATDGDSFGYLPVDGTRHVFVTVMSGPGAKYASGPYVWWTKGPQGHLSRDGDSGAPPLLANCVERANASRHAQ